MAYRAALRISRNQQCTTYGRANLNSILFSDQLPTISQERKYYNGNNGNNNRQQESSNKWGQHLKLAAGFGIATSAIVAGFPGQELLAQEEKKASKKEAEDKIREREARIRKTQTLDRIFDYFATYRYINEKGKNVNLMSIKDFYNAVTPGSSITHGTGMKAPDNFVKVTDRELQSDELFLNCEVPVPNSILNKIARQGLLSYTDFCFLMNLLATPFRHLDIAFLAFDITGDGEIEAKEFLKVMTHITTHTGGLARYDDCGTPKELMKCTYSGLMNYFFGKDRKKLLKKEAFMKFRGQLIDEMLWLEFTRYCHSLPELPSMPNAYKILSYVEFCEHLLAHSHLPAKKKESMIRRVIKHFGECAKAPTQLSEGISYSMFKSFYHVLYCGSDLERCLEFLEADKGGIIREEFVDVSKTISDEEVDSTIVDIIFLLFDEDEDHRLTIEEFSPLLADWRLTRAFMQASTSGATIVDLKLS